MTPDQVEPGARPIAPRPARSPGRSARSRGSGCERSLAHVPRWRCRAPPGPRARRARAAAGSTVVSDGRELRAFVQTVEADDRDVVGDGDPAAVRHVQDAERHLVVGDEQAVEVGIESPGAARTPDSPLADVHVAGDDRSGLDAGIAQGVSPAVLTIARLAPRQRAGEVPDPSATERQQMARWPVRAPP